MVAKLVRFVLRWWFLGLVFSVPFALKYITKDPFAISWLNVWSVSLIGLTLWGIFLRTIPFTPVGHRPFIALMALLFLALAWGLMFTDPIRNGIGLWTSRLTQPFLVGWCGYQLLAARVIKPKEIVMSLFLSLVGLLGIGLMQWLGFIDYRDPGRITATYFYPNTFARYLDIILLISLPWILFQAKAKRILLGFWVLGSILLVMTQSYNGVLTLMIGLMTMFVMLPKQYDFLKKIGLGVVFVTVLLIGLNAKQLPKYQTSINDSRLTRLEFWAVATNILQDKNYFWTGIGIKTWEKEYPQLVQTYFIDTYHKLPLNWGSVQPHNVFLDSFIKAGLPGFIAITALLVWPVVEGRSLSKTYSHQNPNWWVGISLAAYGVGMVVFGLIDDPIWSDDTMPVLFILYFNLVYCVTFSGRKEPLLQQ